MDYPPEMAACCEKLAESYDADIYKLEAELKSQAEEIETRDIRICSLEDSLGTIEDVVRELYVAVAQTIPSDDQIIMDHVRQALALAKKINETRGR